MEHWDNRVPIHEITAEKWEKSEDILRNGGPHTIKAFLPCPKVCMIANETNSSSSNGMKAGDIWKNPDLAETYRTLATQGKRGFYEGRIAEAIVTVVREHGYYSSVMIMFQVYIDHS
jgi:gamma-glutamyltranspeptidase/glutathione hydrolase